MKASNIDKTSLRTLAPKSLQILIFLLGVLTIQTSAQILNLDTTFNAGVTDAPASVYVSATQPDGKVLVGGFFSLANNSQKPYLVRLNSDGTTDNSFNPGGSGPNASVFDIIVLADGKLLVGGSFSSYNGTAKGGLVRLNSDGSIDTTFNAGGIGVTGTAQTVELQADGKILIAGTGISAYNGVSKFSVVRVNADGTLDASFTSPFTSSQFVEEVQVQSDGKILIGGVFTIGSPVRVNIARLNSNGSIDVSFNPNGGGTEPAGGIYAMILLADGRILIGGDFSDYNNNFRPKIARLNSDGSLDATFNPGSLDGTSAEYFAVQPDGKILVAGRFIDFFNQQFSIIRLNANGSLDNTFQPLAVDNGGYNVKLQSDGKIILTGRFTRYGGENRRGIVRLNSGGGIDNSFNASFSNLGVIDAAAVQADGKIIVGGAFRFAGGAPSYNIARFNQDGTLDTTFKSAPGSESNTSDFSNTILDIAVQPDGKILVGGSFGGLNGTSQAAIVRLNSDGTADTTFKATFFDPAQSPFASDIFVQSDGKILVGGAFIDPFGQSFKGLVRLNTNGSLDSTFNNSNSLGANSTVRKIVRQTDGRFIIGGNFTAYNGAARNRVARINADGTLDSTFNPGTGANGTVLDIALQSDNKILIAGAFTGYNGMSRNRLARLNIDGSLDASFNVGSGADSTVYTIAPQQNGKILIGGFFANYNGTSSNRLARINADGSLDNTFVSGFTNNPIYNVREILNQANGKVLIGGIFDSYNGGIRNSLLLLTTPVIPTRFDYDGDKKADISLFRPSDRVWYIANSSGAVNYTQFGLSTDKIVPADYDGDGKTDIAVYRPENGVWFILKSSGGVQYVQFGIAEDYPMPADYNGDGKAEIAVFRPSTGVWFIYNDQSGQYSSVQFGISEDKPVVADYNGDGKAEIAVYRPSSGLWFIYNSDTKQYTTTAFGVSTDKPVQADYDGDGRTDIAVYRPAEGNWYISGTTSGYTVTRFGLSTDKPVPADYDGDGRTDIAVYRPNEGNWYQLKSRDGFGIVRFGLDTDKPTPNAFVY